MHATIRNATTRNATTRNATTRNADTIDPHTIDLTAGTDRRRPHVPGALDGGYEGIHVCNDPTTGLLAIVCIDSTVLGPADGGVRMLPYPSFESAVADVTKLARSMTLKWAAAGEHRGGGKAVIVADPRTDKTEALLRRFGRFVESLGGAYWAGADSGLTLDDMAIVHRETDFVATLPVSEGGAGDISPATAAGVLHAMRACASRVWGDPRLHGRKVVVQGVGECGTQAVQMLAAEGAEVVVADTDERRVACVCGISGVRQVDPADVYDVAADVFAPFALGGVIDHAHLARLDVAVVAGSANNVMVDDDVEDAVVKRGIVYAVDFVANAGGAIMDADRFLPGGFDAKRVARKLEAIGPRTLEVLDAAAAAGVLPSHAARNLAEARLRVTRAPLRSPA